MSLDGDDIPSENGIAFPSENRNRKSRRYSKDRARRSNLIAEETDSLTKSSDTRLRVDEDRERMTLNPGKSLKSSAKDLPKYYRSTFLYSWGFFVLAYAMVYLPGKIASAFLASLSSRGPVIYHHKILFTNVVGWERGDALSIFTAPLVVDFLQSVLYTTVFLALKRIEGYWKILAFWLMFHSYLRLTGCVLPGMVSGEEFGYVAGWLYMNSAVLFILFFLSILAMLGLSALLSKWAMECAFSKHMVMKKKRQEYLVFYLGLPVLSGILLIALFHGVDWSALSLGQFKVNDWWASVHELTLLGQALLMYGAAAAFVLLYKNQEILCQRDLRMQKINPMVMGLSLLLPLFGRIVLADGWFW